MKEFLESKQYMLDLQLQKTKKKIEYYCPACGNEVWAYAGFEGNTCRSCRPTLKSGSWIQLIEKYAPKQKDLRYRSNGTVVELSNRTFENVLPDLDGRHWNNTNK